MHYEQPIHRTSPIENRLRNAVRLAGVLKRQAVRQGSVEPLADQLEEELMYLPLSSVAYRLGRLRLANVRKYSAAAEVHAAVFEAGLLSTMLAKCWELSSQRFTS